MNKIEVLAGILKRIGNVNVARFGHSFKDRLIVQKTIYFLQVFKLNLGYFFNWYLYGPYSKALADDGYKLSKVYSKTPAIQFGNMELEEKFNKLTEFLGKNKTDPNWLELLSSIHFLVEIGKSKITIREIVTIQQKHFSNKEFESAWNYLVKNNLIKGG